MSARLLVSALLAVVALGAAGGAAAASPAIVSGEGTRTVVRALDGTILRTFKPLEFPSLGTRLLAGGRGNRIVALDAVTGTKRFEIRDAFGPVVLPGRRVVFLGDRLGHRDPQVNSVWIRTSGGAIRKLVQFANGPGLPGVQTGLDASIVLGVASDSAGRKLAIVQGNDVDLFHYDIWVVDTGTKARFRATSGGRSRFATLDPAGARLAYLREEAFCGGPEPGYRAGDVLIEEARKGAAPTTLLDGDCDAFYTELAWLSATELVATRVTRTAPDTFRTDLVSIDVATSAVTVLAGSGDVFALSVSPTLRLVAFMRGAGGADVLDIDTMTTRQLANAFAPQVSRDGTWP
ncbi:MAG: hypothetical protein U0R69_15340 [Gaiellales bacterium]